MDDAAGIAWQMSGALKQELLGLLRKIEERPYTWPCRESVDPSEVPDYLDVVPNPIDLKTMAARTNNKETKNKNDLLVTCST
jgi:Bromodomain